MDEPCYEALPPQPPQMPRRVRLNRSLAIGIPLLVLVGLQVFGERLEHAELTVGELEVKVQFPSRLRETMRSSIKVDIHNTGGAAVSSAEVEFDPAYLGHFGELSFTPAAGRSYVVTLPELPPGHVHRIVVEVRAHKLGRRSGTLTVRLPDGVGAVELHTFTFP